MSRQLILASGSTYKQGQLRQLGYEFESVAPDIDESIQNAEPLKLACLRLATQKAGKVLESYPNAVVIGSDQICVHSNEAFGKPGTVERAIAQLTRLSGQEVLFHSAIAIGVSGNLIQSVVTTEVIFRELTQPEIRRYIELDNPIDCAGAIKSELRGLLLLERVTSDDPSALVGLPLIQTAKLLRDFDINPLVET